mgnify:CR=1 FL=1
MNSLEWRLQLGLAVSLVMLIGLFWLLGNQSLRDLTEDFIASRLEHDMEALLVALRPTASGPHRMRRHRVDQVYNQPFSGHYYTVLLDNGGQLSSRSLWDWDQSLPLSPLPPGEKKRLRVTGPIGQQLLVLIKGFRRQEREFTLAVAEDLTPLRERRNRFKRNFALLALAGLLTLLAVQRFLVRRSFRRLEPIREDIRRLEQGAAIRLSEQVPTEILPLVQEFNQLLGLLSQRLERSRNALGNLAHALKSPLNLLTQYLDAESPDNGAQRQQARAQAERIRQLMARELKRARLAGKGLSGQRFDPQSELPDLIGALRQVHRERQLRIDIRIQPSMPAFGDREDMLELLGNLLDNACKWASAQVSCSLATNGEIRISIEDDGSGLSDQQLERMTRRGTRLDETVEGHGLGLAIAKDIVKLYGGEMGFGRSTRLGGLEVWVRLPRGGSSG